jgi:hypothetical protein
MNRPITSDVQNTDLNTAKELYRKYATERPKQEQIDVTDVVNQRVKHQAR